ncbi:putative AC transposase, partial [Bienertia sinuspersici]
MEMFRTYDGRVSLTSDTWTSTYREPFVCVTAHWIDDDWLLQKRIICFETMEEAHNGFNIKTRIVSCCKNFHLVDKLFSISLDNAMANKSAMKFLKEDPSIKLVLNGSLMHVLRLSLFGIFKHKCDEYGLRNKVIALDTPTRWNSTYKLLHDAIAYPKIVHDVLETFDNATHIFSYVYEPNIHMVILECIKIIFTIKQTSLANPGPSIKRLLDNVKVKWCAYFAEYPPIYVIVAILDPSVKLEESLCEDYGAVIQLQPVRSSMDGLASSSPSSLNIVIGEYLTYQFETEENFHIIQWWKNHSSKFPVLARIAKYILAIPASTIASKSAFSAGRRVLDEKRSRLSSKSIEMCI